MLITRAERQRHVVIPPAPDRPLLLPVPWFAMYHGAMRCVVLGDIHLYRLWLAPWRLLGKRLLGQTNLWLNRSRRFDPRLLTPVLERASSLRPEMVLLSGDLTTTALPGEFRDARRALGPLGKSARVYATPGNHDRYTFASARRRTMERELARWCPQAFPHIGPIGEGWRLVVLNSAVPRTLNSRGRLGQKQLQDLARGIADMTAGEGLLVLCHYPLASPESVGHLHWEHRLADADELAAILHSCPARVLYVHGHVHCSWLWRDDGALPAGVVDLNAGAPTMVGPRHPHGQGFWELELGAGGRVALTHHRYDGRVWQARSADTAGGSLWLPAWGDVTSGPAAGGTGTG